MVMDIESDACLPLQRSVTKLHFGSYEEKKIAALDIEKLAVGNAKARKMLAELGVIPPLVDMVDSTHSRLAATKALISLVNDSYKNKELVLEAGILDKVPNTVNFLEEQTRTKFAELILHLSSFEHSQYPLCSYRVLVFLGRVLGLPSSSVESKASCLGVLSNFSGVVGNISAIAANGMVPILLSLLQVKELTESVLAILVKLIGATTVKRVVEKCDLVPASFIEVLKWKEMPNCQELAACILTILGSKSSYQRGKMLESGIIPVLLEVALLGSPHAQKRAMRMMNWFKEEGESESGKVSDRQRRGRRGRRVMKDLVRQSLLKNLESISLRASAAGTSTTQSKIL